MCRHCEMPALRCSLVHKTSASESFRHPVHGGTGRQVRDMLMFKVGALVGVSEAFLELTVGRCCDRCCTQLHV